ncbi:hypothetical protein JOD24_001449 [Kroppenstedtia sanguinis]|uniref:Immunity protein Imm6 n=1 Tax=Kroppenstedtia sanguinis TaxID=1380684 RepID=A0ABW4CBW7_9BACL
MNKISQGIEELLNMYKSYKISPEQAISDQYDFLIDQIKDETDASVLIHALDKDISDLMYLDVYFMFFAYKKAIQLDPVNKGLIEDFIYYVDIHSGPDWEQEVNKVRMYLDHHEIEKAGKESLKIDYNKWD